MMVTIVTCQAETIHGHVSCTAATFQARSHLPPELERPSSVPIDWQEVETEASPP